MIVKNECQTPNSHITHLDVINDGGLGGIVGKIRNDPMPAIGIGVRGHEGEARLDAHIQQ